FLLTLSYFNVHFKELNNYLFYIAVREYYMQLLEKNIEQ
ncbi:unnamed protein product, partial [Rotaria sp. Silwood1]